MAEKNTTNLDYEIVEPEDYTGKQDEGFSHAVLVMASFRKAIENGSVEMREGYWNTKFDRLGNAHKIWIPYSRQTLIETSRTALMIMKRDFDKETEDKIKAINKELKIKYDFLCELEKETWEQNLIKEKLARSGFYYREGFLSKGLPYFLEYIDDKVEAARQILEVLDELNKKLNDYKEGYYE